jgi:hypothetical protein
VRPEAVEVGEEDADDDDYDAHHLVDVLCVVPMELDAELCMDLSPRRHSQRSQSVSQSQRTS